ncbi:MAG: ATPase [Desulfobacteraceae bacterium 4484_190.1]|nr:MAG: ATPase [Desulfobacteraceae bacterium 4484_190.1]
MEKNEISSEDDDKSGRLPNRKELEKKLSDYLSKKYGSKIKVSSPIIFPVTMESSIDGKGVKEDIGNLPAFDMLPEELESYLNGFIVKQEDAKAVLSTKICTHFNRIKYSKETGEKRGGSKVGMIKNNILMIGPTGVGKTYVIKLIADKLGVPFVKGDATKFSETGYVGADVEDLIRDLVYEANDNVELAENGIIYIDEIDKIASSHNLIGHDVSRTGVQRALLKPMEETDVDLKVPHDPISQIQAIEHYRKTGKREKKIVNTKNILFIMSGAFGNLADIIKKRLQSQEIGFEADVKPTDVPWEILKEVTAQDLTSFGFESEFIGRLPVIVVFDELMKEDLFEILKNPNNPIIISKRLDFRAYGIDIKFEDEALMKIAELASETKTGARGLVSAIEKVLIPFEKRLPSLQFSEFLVTPETVASPDKELELLLKNPHDPDTEERFEKARKREIEHIKSYISEKVVEFQTKSKLDIYEKRIELIAKLYLTNLCDINTAFDNFKSMYNQVRFEEDAMIAKVPINISFDESAIDEIISQSIDMDLETDYIVHQVAKKLEYGLKLVKDYSGIERFIINDKAIADIETYLNDLIKKFYSKEYED